MRPSRVMLCLSGAAAAAVIGAISHHYVAEAADSLIATIAPGYYPGCYPWAVRYSTLEFDAARKIGWGNILFQTTVAGSLATGFSALALLLLKLGGVMSLLRAYLVICTSGIAGGGLGGAVGYLLGVSLPGYYRSVFRAGSEPWFDPVQVGIGLGISQGLITGVIVGSVVVVAVAWSRSPRKADSSTNPGTAMPRS